LILAGDVGGTKTHLGLFSDDPLDAQPLAHATYPSRDSGGLEAMTPRFYAELREGRIAMRDGAVPRGEPFDPRLVRFACFGVAGPVENRRVETTNLPWDVDAAALEQQLGLQTVALLNDLEANAYGLPLVANDQLVTLQHAGAASPAPRGNQAVISAGTGLGEAGLYWDGDAHRPFPSEGGHTDFAPRTEVQDELLRWLRARFGRVSYERIVCGPGLVNLYEFFREKGGGGEPPALRDEMTSGDPAGAISRWALDGRSALCDQALTCFVDVFGAEAGNLALKMLALGGVYIGGGIAPKILPRMRDGRFIEAFRDKGRLRPVVESMPVRVVLESETAFLGAARRARQLSAAAVVGRGESNPRLEPPREENER